MSAQITDIILAGTTVIYTVGTFLLWFSTQKSVKILLEQLLHIKAQSVREGAFNRLLMQSSIYDAHRAIWIEIISNDKFSQLLLSGIHSEPDRLTGEFIGSILINHCARMQAGYEENLYDESDRDSFARDARHLFSFPLVKNRWGQVKKFHKKSFIDFVDSMVEA